MKIVVVEDEVRIREGIGRLIHKLDEKYEIAGEAENGLQGLEMVRMLNPEIIITDIRMPVMDGLVMLQNIYEEGYQPKAVVLSAYSEFEYARQALKLGVTEYLLKPINLNDFSKALSNAKRQVEKERMKQPEEMGSLEQIFGGLLWSGLEADAYLVTYVEQKYKIKPDAPLIQICMYLGEYYEEGTVFMKQNLRDKLSSRKDTDGCILEAAYEKSIYLILYHFEDAHRLERWFQYEILQQKGKIAACSSIGWIQGKGLSSVKNSFETLCLYMDWAITLGDEVMISYPKITKVQTVPCTYPIELENQIKVFVCTNDRNKAAKCLAAFHEHFHTGKLYAPKEVKECYVRFLWALINIAKEVGSFQFRKLEQQKLLESIMNARTRQELRTTADRIIERLRFEEESEEEMMHLTVKRAKSIIREFYQSGITLNEIAGKLNITPEYLGTQFHREVGVNFSTYIRDFRISKAKELLIGTQLKLYEISEQVGYTDPKYFSRVFKECVGLLPADYRKTHK